MPSILDVAIGVVFVFLLFSLVASALNEVILSYLDRRARFLKEGLSELFRDSGTQPTITADTFLQHGMIAVLSRGKYAAGTEPPKGVKGFFTRSSTKGVPSYIPGKSFVLAVLDLVTEGKNPAAVQDLRKSIENIGNKELKQTLLALYDDAKGNLDHFKANIENWFNESMDRVSGWYKRYAQQWLLVLSLTLAIVCNVDSVRIIRALSMDSKLRESILHQAESYARSQEKAFTQPAPDPQATPAPMGDVAAIPLPANASPTPMVDPEEKIAKFKRSLANLEAVGVPIGWSDGPSQRLIASLPTPRHIFSGRFWTDDFFSGKTSSALGLWFSALIGWVVVALAASLGAPFWFDLLNRFMDIRGVGRAPEESDTTAPKRPATGVESYVVTGDARKSMGPEATQVPQTGVAPQKG
jgi:hypothetical protein